jgi:AcrR family transcriptional regulator
MRGLAERLSMRAPSIYKHFPSKDALEAALIARGFEQLSASYEAASEAADEPIAAIARAYRAFAQRHPNLFRLMLERATPRHDLLGVAAAGDRDLARAIWGFAHGMTTLELTDRFGPDADLDAAWRRGLGALQNSGR